MILDGYKTYIIVVLLIIIGIIRNYGIIDDEAVLMAYGILGPLSIAAVRDAINK